MSHFFEPKKIQIIGNTINHLKNDLQKQQNKSRYKHDFSSCYTNSFCENIALLRYKIAQKKQIETFLRTLKEDSDKQAQKVQLKRVTTEIQNLEKILKVFVASNGKKYFVNPTTGKSEWV